MSVDSYFRLANTSFLSSDMNKLSDYLESHSYISVYRIFYFDGYILATVGEIHEFYPTLSYHADEKQDYRPGGVSKNPVILSIISYTVNFSIPKLNNYLDYGTRIIRFWSRKIQV